MSCFNVDIFHLFEECFFVLGKVVIKVKIIIQKYGGTSMADANCIRNVAMKVIKEKRRGKAVIVVVSAQAGITDMLNEKAKEISSNPSKRELDMMLATGEQVSISLLAMAIHEMGEKGVSYTAQQVGIITDENYTNARIKNINSKKIMNELKDGKIVILPGFQGTTKNDEITTLGRGGSDTSAVAIGVAVNAEEVEIYTDVTGVYSADPRIVKNARKIDFISYDEMLEMAGSGAKVLHYRSVELAAKNNIKIHLRSSFDNSVGTIVKKEDKLMDSMNKAKITIGNIEDKSNNLTYIFNEIAKAKINVDIITQNQVGNNKICVSYIVDEEDYENAFKISEKFKDKFIGSYVKGNKDIAKISVIGIGMKSTYGVAAKVFSALADENIDIDMVSTSSINISCIVKKDDYMKALNIIHIKLLEE
jgi:aspartate kinase